MDNAQALRNLAGRQFDVFSLEQAQGLKVHGVALGRAVRNGTLHRLLPGVYGYEKAEEGLRARLMAACLWAGKDAVVSHRAAGALLRLDGIDPERVEAEITIGRERVLAAKTVIVHRSQMPSEDRRRVNGIPMTSEARTLVDLASCVDEETLAMAVDDAWRRKLASLDWIERRMKELGGRGKRGMRNLKRVVDDCWARGKPLESALEVRVWRLLKASKLPAPLPLRQVEFSDVEGGHPGRIDFVYPAQRLAIEADSKKFHGDEAFEAERLRLSRLAADGWRVMHVTWAQLARRERLVARIARALAFTRDAP